MIPLHHSCSAATMVELTTGSSWGIVDREGGTVLPLLPNLAPFGHAAAVSHVRCWGNNGSRISGPSLLVLTLTGHAPVCYVFSSMAWS